ncbi:GNAT family N-acetyltransferase [Haloprofundus sp. MHR1]|uniref:GNAT family N-acetyltransferase n=1 Tax=Haloprofundus sp. MHR1 TaxID=2572921 RepID=UPI0010BEC30D|nr:GNAT family N-acetyltransferase [Haloprofundus sp. MHR1]QCJ47408.1 GNAT family N-acetyltransferase [Haloprofundus sp. MHR1]
MTIAVSRATGTDRESWNSYVERAPHATPFHRLEALEVLRDVSDTTLHLLVGREGEEVFGICPLFEGSVGPFSSVRCPPTEHDVPYLGPVWLDVNHLSQRKQEMWNHQFVEAVCEWIDEEVDPDHLDIRTVDRYPDVRPFIWADLDVRPAYTYVLDLEPGPEEIKRRFSRSTRRYVRDVDDHDIAERGYEGIEYAVDQYHERYENAGVSVELCKALYDALPDGCVRPYVLSVDDRFVGARLTVELDDTIYAWVSAANVEEAEVPVNELVEWYAIRDAAERGLSRYDFVGGMVPSLCRYKSQFAPVPRALYLVQRQRPWMRGASMLYNRLPERVRSLV